MKFDIEDAKALLKPCRLEKYLTIDEHGVWPSAEFDPTNKEGSSLEQWRPAQVFADDPRTPDMQPRKAVARTPGLPPQFNARQLAAFMVGGYGALVAWHYGEWDDGPDPDRLADMPPGEDLARLAVKGAFDAYREAKGIVGPQLLALYAEADDAREARNVANEEANMREGISADGITHDEYRTRRARAVASIAALDSKMEATAAALQAANEAWLKAMVKQLLQPEPAQGPATLAPVAIVASGVIHSTKTRRDTLTPVIELAQVQCRNNKDTAEVWAALQVLANKKEAPLFGATEEGLQYFKDGAVAIFNRKSLSKRLAR